MSPNHRFSIQLARDVCDEAIHVADGDPAAVEAAEKARDRKLVSLMSLTLVELRRNSGAASEVDLIRAGFRAMEIIRLVQRAADSAARFEGGRAWPEAA